MTSPGESPKDGTDRKRGKAESGSSEQRAQDSAPDEGSRSQTGASRGSTTSDTLASAISGLSKLYTDTGKDGVSPQVTDAVTQALLLILGTGPSIVAFDGLLSAQNSNGLMYHNAVSHQQKTNLLGMAMTAKCVRYMLDPACDDLIDESIFGDDAG